MSSLELRGIESRKIECARIFFDKLGKASENSNIKYDVVTDYDSLLGITKPPGSFA
jgi:type III restriction enzyme